MKEGNKTKKRRSWRDHPMMSVSGCIDSHGEIRAKASKNVEAHSKELSKGKRWRWLIWVQDFQSPAPRTLEEANNHTSMLHLNEEEHFSVCDWLIRHGYADEQILPTTTTPHRP